MPRSSVSLLPCSPFVLVAWLLLVGCAEPASPEPPDPDPFEELRRESGVPWRGILDEGSGLPTMIDRPPGSAAPAQSDRVVGEAVSRARAFLGGHPRLFGAALSTAELEVSDVAADSRGGGARVRFTARVAGLPVDGGDVLVVLAPSGDVRAASGALPSASTLAAVPVLGAEAAGEKAVNAIVAEAAGAQVAVERAPELVALERDHALRPAWRVTVAGGDDTQPIRRDMFVDAASGAILHEREGLLAVRARGSGRDVRGRRRELDIFQDTNGTFSLSDDVHGVRTYTAVGTGRSAGLLLRSADPDRWDEGVFGAGAAVDAHANGGQVLDYLAVTFARRSIDGRGAAARLVVHAGDRLDNAFWDGHHAVFGDGDGTTMPLSVGLDVVAHEMFHGVTQSESKLIYEGEPGALNESLSDVFGCLVELDRNDGNWTIGEDVAAMPLRDLGDPERTHNPAHMSQYVHLPLTPANDMGGVHVNSTIPSHAAYLVATGGPFPRGGGAVTGIGDLKMRDIWWRAATTYLGPRARFADFAEATRAAAEDLYGNGAEVRTVESAWRAVGVVR